jgi:hypothetical protein
LITDQVGCPEQRVGIQMGQRVGIQKGVAGCRLRLRMTEELADNRQSEAVARALKSLLNTALRRSWTVPSALGNRVRSRYRRAAGSPPAAFLHLVSESPELAALG